MTEYKKHQHPEDRPLFKSALIILMIIGAYLIVGANDAQNDNQHFVLAKNDTRQ